MKAVFITFDQAHKYDVMSALDSLLVRGFSYWEGTQGRGSINGDPHYGNHAWPTLNNSILAIVDDNKVLSIKERMKAIDLASPKLGLRLFVWTVEDTY